MDIACEVLIDRLGSDHHPILIMQIKYIELSSARKSCQMEF